MRLALSAKERNTHPVDVIEQIAHGHGWAFERTAQDEISVCVAGSWVDYHVSFSWMEEHEALHLACAFNLTVHSSRKTELVQLLAMINEKLLFGHFDYWKQAGAVMYRQTLLLSGGLHPTDAQVKMLLMTALDACEAHYTACQSVVLAGVSSREALRHAMFETMGNA